MPNPIDPAPTAARPMPTASRPVALRLLGAGLAMAMLLGACSDGSEQSTPTTSPSASTTDGASETDGSGTDGSGGAEPIVFESPGADDVDLLVPRAEELVDARPAAILDVAGTDGTELILSFEMGSHRCHGVRAQADETDEEVLLSIETGVLPGVDPASCRYGVYPYTTAVTLADPLGERPISTIVREPADVAGVEADGAVGTAPRGGDPTDGGSADDPTDPVDPDDQTASGPPGGDPSAPSPIERGGPTVGIDDAAQLIGRNVEDGVEWAIGHGVEWRILSYDGEPTADDSPFDSTRISFVVDRDLIVRFEWS